ncbi:MAG: aa3-type cytochrome c oxidase subunit IV [Hyphomicrobiaceae bacterium]|nr:aa3-type cytochrome c oxidase subunit IV [Hyphomicrobiaceae bacterium]
MGVDFSGSHRAMDSKQHKETYSWFIKLTVATCVIVVVVLVGMAAFLL